MANSALKRNPYFNGEARARFDAETRQPVGYGAHGAAQGQAPYGQQPYGQTGVQQAPGAAYGQQFPGQQAPQGQQVPQYQPVPSPEAMNHQFDLPAATPDEMDRMSYGDVIAKTAGVFAVVLLAAVATAAVTFFVHPVIGMGLAIAGSLGALVTGLILSFSKTPKAALTFVFGVCEGLLVGGLSAVLELIYPGIIMQASLATFAVVATTLVLFRFGKVRTSPRLTKIVLIAMIGYGLFSLINFGYVLLVPDAPAWGMRSAEIFGIPIGLIIGVLAVLMGAYMLVMDFEFVENGVKSGAPRSFGWIAAYAIVSSVVFIYVEILRIIAILRGSD